MHLKLKGKYYHCQLPTIVLTCADPHLRLDLLNASHPDVRRDQKARSLRRSSAMSKKLAMNHEQLAMNICSCIKTKLLAFNLISFIAEEG